MGLSSRWDRSSLCLGKVPQVILAQDAQSVTDEKTPAIPTDSCDSAAKQRPFGVVFHPGPTARTYAHFVADPQLEERPPLRVRVVDTNLTVSGPTRNQGAGGAHSGGPSQSADFHRHSKAERILPHVSRSPCDLLALEVENFHIIFEAAEGKPGWPCWIHGGIGNRPLQLKFLDLCVCTSCKAGLVEGLSPFRDDARCSVR
mmetsp:Transcript_66149/g.154937  ORF Transcript_66149/g.154937 Transcript_66149/m.154937 type:complete len:201 (-) Transcript_66149:372-974(-)